MSKTPLMAAVLLLSGITFFIPKRDPKCSFLSLYQTTVRLTEPQCNIYPLFHFPDPNEGPSVEAALSMSPTTAAAQAEPRKAIIGAKKPAGRKGVRTERFRKHIGKPQSLSFALHLSL